MSPDLAVELINATVQLEQPLGDGTRTVGTGFLVNAPTPDGKPRTVLITSAHVFDRMPQLEARIGWRVSSDAADWRYAPAALAIRGGGGPLWKRHPTQDVAAITIVAPPEFTKAAIPLAWLADEQTFIKHDVRPGDEMMALGFPKGLSSNRAGFPILRWGRVASYPLTPVSRFPNFLLDFRVFDGNSGGPVFMADRRRGADGAQGAYLVGGVLTKQVESKGERLEIGVVTHARHVRETIAMLDERTPPPAPVVAKTPPQPVGVQPPTTTGTSGGSAGQSP